MIQTFWWRWPICQTFTMLERGSLGRKEVYSQLWKSQPHTSVSVYWCWKPVVCRTHTTGSRGDPGAPRTIGSRLTFINSPVESTPFWWVKSSHSCSMKHWCEILEIKPFTFGPLGDKESNIQASRRVWVRRMPEHEDGKRSWQKVEWSCCGSPAALRADTLSKESAPTLCSFFFSKQKCNSAQK